MNRLRVQKFKFTGDTSNTDNNNESNNSPLSSLGLFNKITKRYSTFSNRIKRRQQPGRKSTSPSKLNSGSYDMNGTFSEDHRLEIGAPVLVSTTTIDADRFDITEERLRQIGGGIAVASNIVRTIDIHSSPHMPSSGSENEMFVDALSTPSTEKESAEEDKYEEALETPKKTSTLPIETVELRESCLVLAASSPIPTPLDLTISNRHTYTNSEVISPINPLNNYYEAPKLPSTLPPKLKKKLHSKSAQNLHRSELKVFLQKAPSVTLHDISDLPHLPELYGASKCSLAPTDYEDNDNDADKENSTPSTEMSMSPLHVKSDPNSPLCAEQKVCGYLSQQQHYKSVDSLELQRRSNRNAGVFYSNQSINQGSSHNSSLTSHNSAIEDFDLKSVSCQSLNAQNLFVSIDELNEITRQINESEEFNKEIDLEYCLHRDNLKPSERRITLLKNKNTHLISFNNNKEKIKKSWNGVKNWIGEESMKLKEVVQKQANLPRIASSKANLSMDYRHSPSAVGSVVDRTNGSRGDMTEKVLYENGAENVSLETDNEMSSAQVTASNANIADGENTEVDDLDSSFTNRQGEDKSPLSKRVKREGQNGFEELRRYIKQGGDFGKELILILQERAECEQLYSKSLSKMANKLNKACRELPGTVADSWRGVATEMESRSDIHRQLSASLTDEIVKPLKNIIEAHHKTRKTVESNVDKAARVLAEWRVSESKAKKASHTAARENEKLQDAMLDVRIQKSPSIAMMHQGANKVAAEREIKSAEKDCAKLDNKRKKAEEAVKRADVEYYTLCVRAERARVDWEMSVLRGSAILQNIENQRLVNMKNFVSNYTRLTANMNPILEALIERLQPQVEACNVLKDMQVVKNIRRNAEGPSEQLLPDFYCEHTTLAMNRERRKHALIKLLQLVKADLERERRSRNGLKGLSQSLSNQENQNITDKLYHIRSMLTYLEGARFKLHSALLELDHKPRSSHPLAQHIQITRDRTGLQQSILKVPLWLKNNDKIANSSVDDTSLVENDYDCNSQSNTTSNASCTDLSKDTFIKKFSRSKSNIENFSTSARVLSAGNKNKTLTTNLDDPYSDRGQADGGSNQQDSDFDEFSSQDDEEEQTNSVRREHKTLLTSSAGSNVETFYQNTSDLKIDNKDSVDGVQTNGSRSNEAPVVLSRCKALYSYTPKLYDELELNPGDIIEVHAKQEDGWWLGALGNQVGIFPATYVEELA